MRIHHFKDGLDVLPRTSHVTIRCYPHHGAYTEHVLELGEVLHDIDQDGNLSMGDWTDLSGQPVTLPARRAIRWLYVKQIVTPDRYTIQSKRHLLHWLDHRHDLKFVRLKVTRYDGRYEYLDLSMREANRVLTGGLEPIYQKNVFHVTKRDGKNRNIQKRSTRSITFEYAVIVLKA